MTEGDQGEQVPEEEKEKQVDIIAAVHGCAFGLVFQLVDRDTSEGCFQVMCPRRRN